MRPFEFPSGPITRDAYKAMRLQLDPDDDEAEWKIRRKLEKRSTIQIHNSLQRILNKLDKDSRNWDLADDFRRDFEETMKDIRYHRPLQDAVTRTVLDAADLGVSMAADQLGGVGIGIDYETVNGFVREWATERATEVMAGIDNTTERLTAQAVDRWLENGGGRQALIDDLSLVFDEGRAERIASTEITRAAAEGNKRTYQATGVTRQMQWRAAQDERMCPICGALHGQNLGFDEDWRGFLPDEVAQTATERIELPPAHPNCRCWVIPVISRPVRR